MSLLRQLQTDLFILQQRIIVLEKMVADLFHEIKQLESRNADDA
jgi:hypothetical protein